jgi:hypothetical protein
MRRAIRVRGGRAAWSSWYRVWALAVWPSLEGAQAEAREVQAAGELRGLEPAQVVQHLPRLGLVMA